MPLLGSQPVPLGGDPRVFLDTLALFVKAAEHSLRSSTFLISQRLERPERLAVLRRSQWHMTVLQQPPRKTALMLTALLSAVPSARAARAMFPFSRNAIRRGHHVRWPFSVRTRCAGVKRR